MRLASRRFRTRVTGASRGIAMTAIAASLVLAIPFATAQEEAASPAGDVEAAAPIPDGSKSSDAAREPDAESAVTAHGWGDASTAVRYVEGAARDAPLSVDKKPRPQNDWFVQRLQTPPPRSLNPIVSDRPAVGQISRYVLGRLLVVDPDAPPNALGSLATGWVVTDGGRTCTYTLRKGVQFADGRPFTSADVLFSFNAARDPAVTAEHLRAELQPVTSMTAPDAHTVVVKFRAKLWKSPYVVGRALPILNKGWYEEQLSGLPADAEPPGPPSSAVPGERGFAARFNALAGLCPGTGPYYLADGNDLTNSSVLLTPNPFSWEMQVYPTRHNFAGLRWTTLPTEGDAFYAFARGELDIWVVSHAAWENQLSRDPRIDAAGNHYVYDHIGIDASAIAWNTRKPPFDDVNVRRAMTFMIDRQEILDNVEQGYGAIACCKSKRAYATYSTDLQPIPFDLVQAEARLIRAGWSQDSDGDGILDKKGKPLTFKLTYPAGRRNFDAIAEMIQSAGRQLGVDVRLDPVGAEAFHQAVRFRRFDAIMGYSQWPDPWIDLYGSYHRSQDVTGGGNITGWRNDPVDDLLEKMRAELDDDARTKLHHQFNAIFHAEQPETLLIHGKVGVLVAKRLEGISVRPTGLQTFDLWVRPAKVKHKTVQAK